MPLSTRMATRFTTLETLDESASSILFRVKDATSGAEARLRRWKAQVGGLDAVEKTLHLVYEANNPHVEEIVEVGSDDVGFYTLLGAEWGEPLPKVLAEGPLRVEEFESLADQVIAGLAAVHERGVVHGALRPEVIRVLRKDGAWKIRIGGFGLGFDTSDPKPLPHYRCAAPEIWDGEGLRRRTDVYALGCVLYECLGGRPAFDARDEKTMRHKHRKHDVLALDRAAPHVPRWMAAWVMKLMMSSPDKRPANAGIARQLWEQREAGLVATAEALPGGAAASVSDYGGPPPPISAPVRTTTTSPEAGSTSRTVSLPVIPLAHPNTTRTVPISAQRPSVSAMTRLPIGTAKPPGPPVKWIVVAAAALGCLAAVVFWSRHSADLAASRVQELKPVRGVVTSLASKVSGSMQFAKVGDFRHRPSSQTPPGPAPAYPAGVTPPPATDKLVIHLRADLAPYTFAGDEAETKPARDGDILGEWHDFGALLQDNTFSTTPWQPGNRSVRLELLAPKSDFPLCSARRFVTFSSASHPACSLGLSARGAVKPPADGVTLGLVFFAKKTSRDMNLAQLSFDKLSLNIRASKDNTLRVVTNTPASAGGKGKPTSKSTAPKPLQLAGVDFSEPSVLLLRWQAKAPMLRIVVVNGSGETTDAASAEVDFPQVSLSGIILGGVSAYAHTNGSSNLPHFDGGIAEFLLYNQTLDDKTLDQLRDQLTGYYFP